MANIDNVQLPDGSSYNIVDNTSGFATQNYVNSAVSSVTKTTIGLGNVDNTSDLNKPISTATQTALDTLDEDKADKTDIATVESGTTASRAYSIGELVYVSGTLYRVKTAIASGATFTVGTNVEVTNVSNSIAEAVRKPIAVFTLGTGQIPLDTTQMNTINGNWSVEDASIYSINGSTLTLLKDGVYLIENNMHGFVMPQSYIQTAAYVSSVGNAATGQVVNGLEANAIQGYSSSSYLRRLNAGTEITLRGYSLSASNGLYGSNLSTDNRMTVTKL